MRTLLLFHAPGCVACQKAIPPIEAMASELAEHDLRLHLVDAHAHLERARALGVTHVPAAFVVDADGAITRFESRVTAGNVRHALLRHASAPLARGACARVARKCAARNVRAIVLCAPADHPAHDAWRAHCKRIAPTRSVVRMHADAVDVALPGETAPHVALVTPSGVVKAMDEVDLRTNLDALPRLERLASTMP